MSLSVSLKDEVSPSGKSRTSSITSSLDVGNAKPSGTHSATERMVEYFMMSERVLLLMFQRCGRTSYLVGKLHFMVYISCALSIPFTAIAVTLAPGSQNGATFRA